MTKHIFIIIASCLFPMLLWAQDRYTLVEDREFAKDFDVYGYTFVPAEGKMTTAHYPDPIDAGIVSFEISSLDVTIIERANYTPAGIVNPPTDDKAYKLRLASIEKTKFGWQLNLVNIRNRDMKGYLKLYIDGYSRVDLLKYRPSYADPEHTYIIKPTSPEQALEDGKYFTHTEDFDVRSLDELWGKTLYPFMSLENESNIDYRKIRRIYKEDDISVKFEERTVQTKTKKEKILQYVIVRDKEGTRTDYLLKKAKEVEHSDRNGRRHVLELIVKNEAKDQDCVIYLHRGVKSYLKAIEIQNAKTKQSLNYYEMRKGKSIIVETPTPTPETPDKAEKPDN